MKRFLLVSLTLILSVTIALPAMAVTLDYPPVLIETDENGGRFSLTVENLPETFEVNKKSSQENEREYYYEITFCDGTAYYDIGVAHFKVSNNEPARVTKLFDRGYLSGGDGMVSTYIKECSHERDGDTITFLLEEPISDLDGYTVKIDYENIIAFGYSITGEQNVYYRILVGGALEELTWEQYYDLLK